MPKISQSSVLFPKIVNFALVVLIATSLAACTARIDLRGNMPDPERLSEIKPGEFHRDEIVEILGSPSSIAVFEQETWYYVSQRTETVAFFAPEIKERTVLILRFDKDGTLAEMETLSAKDGQDILPVDRKTPTAGNEMTVLDQLFGNMGRFK